jgi:4-amino-4-deoxy-L-arabinose transferase-like glycosyltransferase
MLQERPDRRTVVGVLAILLLAFLGATGLRPLNVPDEGRYADVARWMLRSGDFVTPRLAGVPFLHKPPLFYWLEASSFWAFGVHVWSARLVPALLGFAGCALTFAAGARLFGRRAGLLAAVILAANPYYFVASQYVNHDLTVSTFITAALLLFTLADRAGARNRGPLLLAAWASCGLALLTKGLIGVVIPVGVVGLWIAATSRWREIPRYRLVSGLALAAAIAVPWHLAAERATPGLLHELYVVQHFSRYAATGFNNAKGAWFYPAVLLAGLVPWTPLLPGACARAWRAFRAERDLGRSDLLLLVWPVFVLVFFSIPESKLAGYALPALPPLALLLGRHLDALWREGARSRALAASAATVAAFGAGLLLAPLLPAFPQLPRPALAGVLLAGAVGLAAAVVAFRAARAAEAGRAAVALAAFVAALVAGGMPAVPHFTRDSALPLANDLSSLLRPGDTLAFYGRYYYDLPFYLDLRKPPLVAENWDDPAIPLRDNWQSEVLAGRVLEPRSREWLVSFDELEARCAGTRCFVLAPRWHEEELQRRLPVVKLAQENRIALFGPPDALNAGAAAGAAPGPAAAAR